MAMELVGRTLGPFQVEAMLGKGAMGAVYRARHQETGKLAAIKVVLPEAVDDANALARFEREIKLLSQFRHPNIVRCYGASHENGIRYYAMELVEGKSLEDILTERGAIPFRAVIGYTIQLCEALQEIHGIGVVHRDLKPANMMIAGDHKVKLTDFGIAKNLSAVHTQQLTAADHTVGTVAYMSPEQLGGHELTRRSDLYSMGMIVYRCLTGQLPFNGETLFEYLNQRQSGVYRPASELNGEVPIEFDELIAELLANNPDDRPRDAYVVMQRLLDIRARAKDGSLQKTRQIESSQMEAKPTAPSRTMAVSVAGMLRNVTQSLSLGGGSKRRKKSGDAFFDSTGFLVLCLVAIVGFGAWMVWPPGEELLYARGAALMESEQYSDWEAAFRKYFGPLRRRFPESRHLPEVQEFEDRVLASEAEGQLQMAWKVRQLPRNASEAMRQFYNASLIGDLLNDQATAEERYAAIIRVFDEDPKERRWVLLARRRLANSIKFDNDEARKQAKRQAVADASKRADEIRLHGNISQSVYILESITTLYAGDADVADLVGEARKKLFGPTPTSAAADPTDRPRSPSSKAATP